VASLVRLDTSRLMVTPPAPRAKRQVREGLAYVARTPELGGPLLMMALVGCLAYEFTVTLPVIASQTFHGNATAYGFMTAAMGLGAVAGGLFVAARGRTGLRPLTLSCFAFGIVIALAALAPTLWLELIALLFVGGASVGFLAKGNSTLQLAAAPTMRGRVMALWAVAFLGSTPIGGPVAGFITDQFGGRAGLWLGAGACMVAAAVGTLVYRRAQRHQVPEPVADAELAGQAATATAA
jgi:MFS family permease